MYGYLLHEQYKVHLLHLPGANMLGSHEQKLFLNFTLFVTGLGYFVDSYDAFSFNMIRSASLGDLGVAPGDLTRVGVLILNCQVTGTLLGGIFWGMLGDRIGRKKALLGSILCYSTGMIANAFVHDTAAYAVVRALVGFGIAGEVGLGATLVAKIAKISKRTYSLALFTLLGLAGVTAAALSIEFVSWRTSCGLGGAGGLLLLGMRQRLFESPLFDALVKQNQNRSNFMDILRHGAALRKWLCCILILAPNFFVTGLLLTLAPEIAKAAHVEGAIQAHIALAFYFTAAVAGDLLSGYLSERWKSRRRVLLTYLAGNMICALIYVGFTPGSVTVFYCLCALFGLFNLWAIATTAAVEQFGTKIRATVTTTSMNFARACLVPMNLGFLFLKPLGVTTAALSVGGVMFAAGLTAIWFLTETYGKSLDDH